VEWARATVRHFKDRVKVWELYNEPNIFFWSGPKELYPVLVKKAYAAVKEEDPEADVLAISTAGIDTAFIDYCMEAGAPFDGLTIHPYRHHLHEEGFMAELRKAKEQVGGRPVWITEMGWPTSRGGAPERKQARLLARTYLSAVASGACRSVSWYNFRNDGTDPFYNEHNFGVLRRDFTPKPAYRALATICRTLSGGEPELLEGFGEHVYALRMGDATALWAPIRRVQLPCRVTGSPRYLNLMGESVRPATDGGGVTTFDLSPGRPLFLQGGAVQPAGVPSYPEEGVEGVVVRF
jgi:hypothetical protein